MYSVGGVENEIGVLLSFAYLGEGRLSSAFWFVVPGSKFTHSFMVVFKELNLLEAFFFNVRKKNYFPSFFPLSGQKLMEK